MSEDFTEYIATRWPRLVRSAVLLGCSYAEAEDVVQSALVRCVLHQRKIERADDRDAYVYRIMVNIFVSSRRRRWTGERATATVPELVGDDETAQFDQTDAVLQSLARLSDDHRIAVVLRYYQQLSEQQMAQVLAVPVGTVKSRLSRALKILSTDPNLSELQGLS